MLFLFFTHVYNQMIIHYDKKDQLRRVSFVQQRACLSFCAVAILFNCVVCLDYPWYLGIVYVNIYVFVGILYFLDTIECTFFKTMFNKKNIKSCFLFDMFK